jgi:hypothetical protein
MSNTWDEIDNIKVDAKNDMLMQAFEYCYQHNIDTVEMQIEFNNGKAIMATITFSKPEGDLE